MNKQRNLHSSKDNLSSFQELPGQNHDGFLSIMTLNSFEGPDNEPTMCL